MKKTSFALITAAFILLMGMLGQMNVFAQEEAAVPLSGTKKILVAYFSHTGNTREIANQIHQKVGGDIFEIQSVDPYPGDHDTVVKQAKAELNSGYKPALKAKVENIGSYDVIFIGYPNWWGTFPAPVKTFLSSYDLSRKTIVPFCTHGGSGLGGSVTDIEKLCPKSTLLEGIAILGKDAKAANDKVTQWLQKINMIK